MHVTPSLTHLLTPWSRVLLEKLTGFQLVKKFPAFYGTRVFITAFTSARHLSLSWASSIQSIPPHSTSWRSILILSSHLCLGLPSGLLPSGGPRPYESINSDNGLRLSNGNRHTGAHTLRRRVSNCVATSGTDVALASCRQLLAIPAHTGTAMNRARTDYGRRPSAKINSPHSGTVQIFGNGIKRPKSHH